MYFLLSKNMSYILALKQKNKTESRIFGLVRGITIQPSKINQKETS